MKDGRGQCGIRLTLKKNLDKSLRAATTSGGNHRNADSLGHGSRQFAIEPGSGSTPVHGRQQDFSRALFFRFLRPFCRVLARRSSASAYPALAPLAVGSALRVDADLHPLLTAAPVDPIN